MKVALCLPVHDQTKALFTASLVGMAIEATKAGIELQIHLSHKCSRIDEAREGLAQAALDGGADWLLWIDSDQTFGPDLLARLIAHDMPIVGCNIRKRIPDIVVSSSSNMVDGRRVPIAPRKSGLEAVDFLGFGVVLTKAEIFEKLPRPWFQSGLHGEDGYFCEQARAAGFSPHIDHSIQVGHIAETVLKF